MVLAGCKDVVIVPRLFVLVEGLVKGSELAVDDEVSDDLLVPVLGPGVNTLRGEGTKVDGIVYMSVFGA